MRAKRRPTIPGQRDAGQKRNRKFINRKNYTGTDLECAIKNWAVDLLAEVYFYGANSLEHRWAKRFWEKSGRRLRGV